MKSSGSNRDTSFLPNRWQLLAAATGSVLLHAAVLIGLGGAPAPDRRASVGKAPMQAYLVVQAAVAEAAVIAPAAPERSTALPEPESRKPGRPAAPVVQTAQGAAPAAAPVAPRAAAPFELPAYRQGAELDPPPRPLDAIDPDYPAAAGLTEGTVVLRLRIGANGLVDEVTVLSADPQGMFEASALAAFGKARFAPGRYLGVAVRSEITVEVAYTPVDRGSAVSGSAGPGLRR